MRSPSYRWVLALLVLFAATQTGSCLECYTCSSPSSGICGDEFSILKVASLPCKDHEDVCFKGSMTVLGVTVTTRACASDDPCQLLHGCSTCKGNLCNSSTNIAPPLIIFAVIGMTIVKFYI